ncbi:MAG TPA: 50S ribosomal protein L29 [Methanocorpusculum sp.]|nr:50S ribosomal protein L29 [Methanocorpusculum sp.]HJJ89704.1 50S ribosomal protein L29 [Methanocorpusculum sp.]HJJ90257.1 50S ribosomal protein L29 [Methanocorpusculum sp.]HJK00806.1 50S ribosomal protein L29 [Methanocorpusculum sp.]HJK01884.1 50S ribosomal protein L29 [Methanocorpusculum sp.]
MAIFRAKEIAQFSDAELAENEHKLRNELIQQYGKVSTGGAPENSGKIREIRRTIARIKTEWTKRQN